MNRSKDSLAEADLQIGTVVYRDHEDAFLARHQPLDHSPILPRNLLNLTKATGGGDVPEAVDAGLQTALDSLGWRPWATARLLFLSAGCPAAPRLG